MMQAALDLISGCDVSAAPLWLVLLLSLSMYPLGILIPCVGENGIQRGGLCDCCCRLGQTLPDHVLVEFDGMEPIPYGPEIDTLGVEISSCFGSMAAAEVASVDESGAITGVTLTSGGSGYAEYARKIPAALSVSSMDGAGLETEITLSSEQFDECGRSYWAVQAVEVIDGGSLYVNDAPASIVLGDDEHELEPASLTLSTALESPTLTAIATTGTGAVFSVTTKLVSTDPKRWGVDTISVTQSGSGFSDGDPVTIETGYAVVSPASAVVVLRRKAPMSVVVDMTTCAGSGASFGFSFSKTIVNGKDVWEIDGLTVQDGGSGYTVGCGIYFWSGGPDTIAEQLALFNVATVGSGGSIQTLTKASGGKFFSLTDEVESVLVTDAGSYYAQSTTVEAVTVNSGGRYYKTDFEAPAKKSSVAIALTQLPPSNGSGAVLSAVIDDNIHSQTFGQISIAIDAGGSGYVKEKTRLTSNATTSFNGQSGILGRAGAPYNAPPNARSNCVFGSSKVWGYGDFQYGFPRVLVEFRGENTAPLVYTWGGLDFTMQAPPPVQCENLSFVATSEDFGGTATVTAIVVE